MFEEPQKEDALAGWEGEGGSVTSASRRPGGHRGAWYSPALPSGYEAQPVWGFRDSTGRFAYEFSRVYGPPDLLDSRGPTCHLDEDLSYWVVTGPGLHSNGDKRPASHWMSFAQARKLRGFHMTFERFSSLVRMREELPELLHLRSQVTSTTEEA